MPCGPLSQGVCHRPNSPAMGSTTCWTCVWSARRVKPNAPRCGHGQTQVRVLSHYYARHGTPLRAKLFAHIATVNRLGQMVAPLANWLARSALGKWAQERLGIAPQRTLPPFARQTFSAWFAARPRPAQEARRGQVVLFHDTFLEYNYPEVGQAATQLLEAAGFAVVLVERQCCGRPAVKGRSSRVERTPNTTSSGTALCPPGCTHRWY